MLRMGRLILWILILCIFLPYPNGVAQLHLTYKQNKSLSYTQCIAGYSALAKEYPQHCRLLTYGTTDVGKPLHLFVVSGDTLFEPEALQAEGYPVLMVMNAIHPGEPDGVDASFKLATDFLQQPKLLQLLQKAVLAIIPFYNVDGALYQSPYHRSNQNGPESCGFRGNGRHLDLNRDFTKADAANTRTFHEIFHTWKPDFFIDNHVTNGADFQYPFTFITSQVDKLNPSLGAYVKERIVPAIFQSMQSAGKPVVPYVNTYKSTPSEGIVDFMDTPRYSTGYANLFNTLGFVAESNKYKPFPVRVEYTYQFMLTVLQVMVKERERWNAVRKNAQMKTMQQKEFPLSWKLDTTQYAMLDFKGYETRYRKSQLTGTEMIVYDTTAPITQKIRYFNRYIPQQVITKPSAYIIPQAYGDVAQLLRLNQVRLERIAKDTVLNVEVYYITDYQTVKSPYEGHYLHYDVNIRKELQPIRYHTGDFYVPLGQNKDRFIVEVLEPQAPDSYFCWNYFDGVLMQKEWFSDYRFEETAIEILEKNPALKQSFEQKKAADPAFAKDGFQQLYFIFTRSPYYELSHNRYPVARKIN
jgi:hypothetical protein